MPEERLNYLSIFSIESEIIKSLWSYEEAIKEHRAKKITRKKCFLEECQTVDNIVLIFSGF